MGCGLLGTIDPLLDLVGRGGLVAQLVLLVDVEQVLEELAGALQLSQ